MTAQKCFHNLKSWFMPKTLEIFDACFEEIILNEQLQKYVNFMRNMNSLYEVKGA